MELIIYFIIFILVLIHIFWTWNNTRDFETPLMRISYMIVGTLFMVFITFLIFQFSKIRVEYPKSEMIGKVRSLTMWIFAPINCFTILPKVAMFFSNVKNGVLSEEKRGKAMRKILIIFAIVIIIECIYMKSIQNDIIKILLARG